METDQRLARFRADALALERATRAEWEGTTGPEKETARGVMRQATQVRKTLDSWIAQRAMRAGSTSR